MLKNRLQLLLILLVTSITNHCYSQCSTIPVVGDLIISSDQSLTGTWNITGLFQIDAGVTVTVTPYAINGCGELVINASAINIQGNINADFAGYTGGAGGSGSTTGTNTIYLSSCNDKDDCYTVNVNGGGQGGVGLGTGGGNSGGLGGSGSGPKQECQNVDDTYGLIGGAGGGGAGGGGSYGATAATGGNGGAGTASGSFTGMSVSSCTAPIAGAAGNGGAAGTVNGTQDLSDIDMGSGGAGAGGGGKSYTDGTSGGNGGTGGGLIMLVSSGTLTAAGTISAQGSAGGIGGVGGAGGKTSRCCSDGCDGCDETTFSAGAGGGGGAGGGSGGGIVLQANGDIMINGTLRAEGGNGGVGGQGGAGASPCNYGGNIACNGNSGATNAGATGAQGGGGSGGRIKVFQNPCRNNVINPSVLLNGGNGNGGTASAGTVYYGNTFGIDIPTITASATNISCIGANDGTVTANPAGGAAPYSYLWSDANAQTTQVATGLAAGNYTVTITDNNGCSVSGSATVVEPDAISVTSVVTNPCSGGTGSIDITSSGGTPGYNFTWLPGGETTEDLNAVAAGTYNLSIEDSQGCDYTTSITLTATTFSVTGIVQDQSCAGANDGSIDLTVAGGSGTYTYLWNTTETTQDILALAAGDFDVTVTDTDNGCTETQTFTVQNGTSLQLTISQSGDTLSATSAPNYQWYFNGGAIPGATNQTYTIAEAGNYYCTSTVQNCEFTSNTIEASCMCVTVSIDPNSLFTSVLVYPNPANQVINVELILQNSQTASILLLDITGRKIWFKEEQAKQQTFRWKIPVSDITAGNYFVQINADGQTKNVKVLVKE